MIRPLVRFGSVAALVVLSMAVTQATARAQDAAAPAPESLAPVAAAAPVFPKPDPAQFTAVSPTKEQVNAFIKTSWGYDENRIWQVQAIRKTEVAGMSKVLVLVGDKTGKQQPAVVQFYTLPDGRHIFANDEIIPFGAHPYAEHRALLAQRATGPYRGSASKDLELVEFADFQCPHCKAVQPNMDMLAADFPKARIVFQNFPLETVHPSARIAATYGVCVAKLGGNDAFFTYAAAVFDAQDSLSVPEGSTPALNNAVTKAGLDATKVEACARTPEAGATVEASVKLAEDLGIDETPMLFINGRQIPLGGIPYETIKQIVEYQAKLDGVAR